MKTKSREAVLLLLVFAMGFVLPATAEAFQQASKLVPQVSSKLSPRTYVPSPLSRLTETEKSGNSVASSTYFSSTIPLTQLVTHKVDLRETLLDHSTKHKCSKRESFLKLEKQLRMSMHGAVRKRSADQVPSAQSPSLQLVGNDVYLISATQGFFNTLQFELNQFRYGDRRIIVEVKFIEIPQTDVATLQAFMIPGSYETYGNHLPIVPPSASNGTYASQRKAILGSEATEDSGASDGTFALATETSTKAFPTFIGHLDAHGVKQIMEFSKSRSAIKTFHSRTMTMYPGQLATVSDLVQVPFVVSVFKVVGENSIAHAPVIQQLEEGSKLALQVNESEAKLSLNGDLVFSKIANVETFEYPNANAPSGGVAIQVPEHQVRRVNWSSEVASNNSILIDSVETFEKEIRPKTRFKAAVTQTMRRLVMITPRLFEQKTVFETNAPSTQVR